MFRKKIKKIVITGGHVTPAVAVIELLIKNNWEISYFGRKSALEGDETPAKEQDIIEKMGIRYYSLTTGRLQRKFTSKTLSSLLKIPSGFVQSYYYLLSIKPNIILSFGGYVAIPVVFSGWLLRIPIVTHEQTFSPGLANRIINIISNKICISWEENKQFFSPKKTILTGNPLRKDLFLVKKKYELPRTHPIIYITGGNLGAHSINKVIIDSLPNLLQKFTLIHQCGNAKEFNDFEKLTLIKNNLSKNMQKRYLILKFVESDYIGWVYQNAQFFITRAGANTMTEIIAFKKLAVFIPLPWSGSGEQEKNAQYLSSRKAAINLNQSDLTKESLLKAIDQLNNEKNNIIKNLEEIRSKIFLDGSIRVAQVVESLV